MRVHTIHQIIPASDWYAVYPLEDAPCYEAFPLVCWALVTTEDEPIPWVVGCTGGELGVDIADNDYLQHFGYFTGAQIVDPVYQERWAQEGPDKARQARTVLSSV
jgi:hypothetical protein